MALHPWEQHLVEGVLDEGVLKMETMKMELMKGMVVDQTEEVDLEVHQLNWEAC